MNTLSINSTRTMSYDADASARALAIVGKLASVTSVLLRANGASEPNSSSAPIWNRPQLQLNEVRK